MGMGSLLPEGQMHMMSGPGAFAPPPAENPWIAAAAGGSSGMPLMPPNPPGPFGPGPVAPVVSQAPVGADMVKFYSE